MTVIVNDIQSYQKINNKSNKINKINLNLRNKIKINQIKKK